MNPLQLFQFTLANFNWVPVHLLYSVKISINKKNINEAYVDIETKDMRVIRFIVNGTQMEKIWKDIYKVAFPKVLWKEVFALKFR